MSDPLKVALQKEEAKLVRQKENHESTKAVIKVLGENAKELGKLDRQIEAMKETNENIKKLKAAIK